MAHFEKAQKFNEILPKSEGFREMTTLKVIIRLLRLQLQLSTIWTQVGSLGWKDGIHWCGWDYRTPRQKGSLGVEPNQESLIFGWAKALHQIFCPYSYTFIQLTKHIHNHMDPMIFSDFVLNYIHIILAPFQHLPAYLTHYLAFFKIQKFTTSTKLMQYFSTTAYKKWNWASLLCMVLLSFEIFNGSVFDVSRNRKSRCLRLP